jgi:seryl-tRNA synthetase
MHDIAWIRLHPDLFDEALAKRGLPAQAASLLALDESKRKAITDLQQHQQRRNQLAKEMGAMSDKAGSAFAQLKEEASQIKREISECEAKLEGEDELTLRLAALPNMPHASVPVGADEAANQLVRSWGEVPSFSFTPKQHFDLGEALGLMDFEQTAKISGARFVTLQGALARMERALAQFMLDLHTTEFGYTEMAPPYLVRDNAMFAIGQLPKFAEDSFQTTDGFRLIPTSEVPLSCMVYESIVPVEKLPIRYTAYSHCFRSEAGSAGRDTRGMIRQHQFSKVELVSITTPEEGVAEHERMTQAAEEVLKRLKLPYRVMLLCSGDMGFAATKTYDLEVWLPGQQQYREISSCSYCSDFVGRRMNARFKPSVDAPTHFLHTHNGSGLAIGRTIVAILENYQQEDGSIHVPEVLRAYMGGMERIEGVR